MNRQHAHPKPDPTREPDSGRRDMVIGAIGALALFMCYLMGEIVRSWK